MVPKIAWGEQEAAIQYMIDAEKKGKEKSGNFVACINQVGCYQRRFDMVKRPIVSR